MNNDYEVRGNVTAIIIKSQKHGRLEALISTDKLERAKEFPNSWYATWDKKGNTFYVHGNTPRSEGRKTACLHRWITNAPKDMEVDHMNHNGLNNTDDNLRIATVFENRQNKNGSHRNSKTGIRGVHWKRDAGKWYARIKLNKQTIFLGYYTDINEAESAVKEARRKHMPYSQEALAK